MGKHLDKEVRAKIKQALISFNGTYREAAARFGISVSTAYQIMKEIKEENQSYPEVVERVSEVIKENPDKTVEKIAEEAQVLRNVVYKTRQLMRNQEASDLEKEELKIVDLVLKNQKLMDSNRVERKLFRDEARKLNECNDLFELLLQSIPSANLEPKKQSESFLDKPDGTLIVQFSDTHIAETVAQPGNVVNTKILSQRLRKFVDESISIGLGFNVRRCIVVFTADLCNSPRRLQSEFLTNEMSTAQAIVIAFEIFSQAIELLSSYFNVTHVVSVAGNENRLANDFDFTPQSLINNGDYIIDRMLKARFHPTIKFSDWGSPCERIVNIDGLRILVTHGITKSKELPEKQLAYYRGKYGQIHYAIMGHLHEPLVHPSYSRSGSPIGKNAYSELSLGIVTSTPSQTCYVTKAGTIKAFPINLENANVEGFIYTPIQTTRDYIKVEEDLNC